ncbi:helix-turn-helix domain-containing protein [Chromobacterium subtsugae]|uniref:helix-turn-helix domain-containing protein n=1 Tax=Chromobacterium subtsugae TaxID=251747 RepID=UPI000B307200|nr:helix-turn-helix transcriptional regulator [Chromobacterium subtsugae]
MSPLAKLLREIRQEFGLSQLKFAETLDLKGPQVSYMEAGKRYAPTLPKLEAAKLWLRLSARQRDMIISADRTSPKLIKIPANAHEGAFIFAAAIQEDFRCLEGEDFFKLADYVRSLANSRQNLQ